MIYVQKRVLKTSPDNFMTKLLEYLKICSTFASLF